MADDDSKLTAKNDATSGKMPAIRSRAFRNALLGRLPKLGRPARRAGDIADVHDSISDFSDLNADSFLEVVARLTGKTNEQ